MTLSEINHQHRAQRKDTVKTANLRCNLDYFTISRFFQRRFLLRHLRHLTADPAFLTPQSRQIFIYNLCCCAMVFLNGSVIGIASSTCKQTRSHTPHKQITFSMQYSAFSIIQLLQNLDKLRKILNCGNRRFLKILFAAESC